MLSGGLAFAEIGGAEGQVCAESFDLVYRCPRMMMDPYKVLGLGHNATPVEIKRNYRKLAMTLHPDRLIRRGASEEEIKAATTKFATVTTAYALLSDPARKMQYDHIYKYGGYDTPSSGKSTESRSQAPGPSPLKTQTPVKGIGYTFTDPIAYVLSQGKVKSRAVAGITIPSRLGMGNPNNSFRLAVSSGKAKESETGSIHCRSTTMLFTGGKKFNKVETTTIHRDGTKEVVIEGDDYVERRFSAAKRKPRQTIQNHEDDENLAYASNKVPWHAQFLKDISSNLQKCTHPSLCGAISAN